MALLNNKFCNEGVYILDEPEAALSPQRQLAFLRRLWQLERQGNAQFFIATHSPILMSYPGAVIYCFDGGKIERINYVDTEHYQLTKDFLNDYKRYFNYLLLD